MAFEEFVEKHVKMLNDEITEKIKNGSDPENIAFVLQRSTLNDIFIVLRDYHEHFVKPLMQSDVKQL